MPIEDRTMAAGTVLVARYKKADRTCEVVETPDGLRYKLDDGTKHKSPSSAGKAAMGGVACNGWRFWSIQGTETPKREPKPKSEKRAEKSAKAKAMWARASDIPCYGCGVCPATFGSQKAAINHALTHTSS